MQANQKTNLPNKEKDFLSHRMIQKISYFLTQTFHYKVNPNQQHQEKTHHWSKVLCLTGVDYFSTLAYQPGIALMAVGALAPLSTLLLILITIFGAVPTYREVTKRSYAGQGSIAMLERQLSGWVGKFCVLGLIAFAVTDFFITMTLSASDAAAHMVENPAISSVFGESHLAIAIGLVIILGFVFYVGFREAIAVAVATTIPFLLLTLIVILKCTYVIAVDPSLLLHWLKDPVFKMDPLGLFIISAIAFPKLALGLSGFETGVSVMPLIHNGPQSEKKDQQDYPVKRIKDTKKLLLWAALIMSVYLIASSVVTSTLLTRAQVSDGGVASGRALSYLAHEYIGGLFGTVYDVSVIVILWFAGASAFAGLLNIIPRYLPRFGMAPLWVEMRRPLVILFTVINIIILMVFKANVNAQAGAYATGVLALILSASIAVALALMKEAKHEKNAKLKTKALYFWFITAVFAYTLADNIHARPDGIVIAFIFFLIILFASAISRWKRAFELRVDSHHFIDEDSKNLWASIKNKKINLVPISSKDTKWFKQKEEKIKSFYKRVDRLAFLTVSLRDDRSDFVAPLEIQVQRMEKNDNNLHISVSGAVAIPNTIAYISEQLDPIAIYLGLARKNAMEQAIFYVLFGEGEIGILTYRVLVQYWESTEGDDVRPVIFLMSE